MDEKDEVEEEEELRDEVWKEERDGNRDVDSFRSNSTGVAAAAADCFSTDPVVRERIRTMPHKNDLY